jgi:hypothetical protein
MVSIRQGSASRSTRLDGSPPAYGSAQWVGYRPTPGRDTSHRGLGRRSWGASVGTKSRDADDGKNYAHPLPRGPNVPARESARRLTQSDAGGGAIRVTLPLGAACDAQCECGTSNRCQRLRPVAAQPSVRWRVGAVGVVLQNKSGMSYRDPRCLNPSVGTTWRQAIPSRCLSAHAAHPTNNHPNTIPPSSIACRVGGAPVKSDAMYDTPRNASSAQSA